MSKGGGLVEATCVLYYITMIMVNVSYVLCHFINCFLEEVFQKLRFYRLKVDISLIAHIQNIEEYHV